MKKASVLLFAVLLALIPSAFAQQETPVPTPPFEAWEGSFEVSTTIPFVWARATPQAAGDIVGTLFPGQVVTAVLPTDGPGLFYEAANDQWWGYFSFGRLVGWIEVARVVEHTAEPESPVATINNDPSTWLVSTDTTIEVRVRRGIPFAWLRDTAASDGAITRTLLTGSALNLTGERVLDTNQYWWPVRDPRSGTEGFVEQSALEYVQQSAVEAPAASGPWVADDVLRVRDTVAFAWLRSSASSTAAVTATLLRGSEVVVVSGPTSDGTQNWWEVMVADSATSGWVEEASLQRVR